MPSRSALVVQKTLIEVLILATRKLMLPISVEA
jgi:hypothetical protein